MLHLLDPYDRDTGFPDVEQALRDPDGLLAVGGDLSPERLIQAYRRGIFPWFSEGQPILWWSPDPRSVLFPEQLKVSRSLRKTLKRGIFEVSFDQDFAAVIRECAAPRKQDAGTWISPEMLRAYRRLHELGVAHSVETWFENTLVGGLYGVALGRVFFGESMFSRRSDASKVAMVHLVERLRTWRYGLIDCQVQSDHLDSLGATNIPRKEFIQRLDALCQQPGQQRPWTYTSRGHDLNIG